MNKIQIVSKLLLSVSVFIFSVTALLFVLKFGAKDLHAVAINNKNGLVFTQSSDGKKLYQWEWHRKKKKWMWDEYKEKWKM